MALNILSRECLELSYVNLSWIASQTVRVFVGRQFAYRRAFLHPLFRASSSVQNQRSPLCLEITVS